MNKIDILKNILILVDTREKKNQHILDYFDANNIPYRFEKLDVGDYELHIPDYPELGLNGSIVVERKGSLSELAGNYTKGRERFKREFDRAKVSGQKVHMVVETATWKKILNGTYRSEFHPKSYTASILTWNIRNDCPTWFCEKSEAGYLIYNILYYELYEKLNELGA